MTDPQSVKPDAETDKRNRVYLLDSNKDQIIQITIESRDKSTQYVIKKTMEMHGQLKQTKVNQSRREIA